MRARKVWQLCSGCTTDAATSFGGVNLPPPWDDETKIAFVFALRHVA
jgi:hypothetical protein